jgi:hypothetical protein
LIPTTRSVTFSTIRTFRRWCRYRLNSLPTAIVQSRTSGTIRRFHNIQSPLGRSFSHCSTSQLRLYHTVFQGRAHVYEGSTASRPINTRDFHTTPPSTTSTSRRHHNAFV